MSDDELAGLWTGDTDVIVLHDGRTMKVHGPNRCLGPHCCIHNPSEHPLKNAPLVWVDSVGQMFRVCLHDHLHPDPDSMEFHRAMAYAGLADFYDGWHPCCPARCCFDDASDKEDDA